MHQLAEGLAGAGEVDEVGHVILAFPQQDGGDGPAQGGGGGGPVQPWEVIPGEGDGLGGGGGAAGVGLGGLLAGGKGKQQGPGQGGGKDAFHFHVGSSFVGGWDGWTCRRADRRSVRLIAQPGQADEVVTRQVGEAVGGVIGEEQAVAPLLGDDESCLGDLAPVPVQQEIAVVLQAEA